MSCYHHLTIEERESLLIYRAQGESLRAIAASLNRSASTLSRELRRNEGEYRPSKAQALYQKRRKASVRRYKLDDQHLRGQVQFFMSYLYWSPEQIENRLRLEGKSTVSFSTIYKALDNGRLRDTLRYFLRRKYKALGKAPKTIRKCFPKSIEQRPPEANKRREQGHWEGDTIYLSREKKYLVTLVDRCSRYLLTGVVDTLETAAVCDVVHRLLDKVPVVDSITFDRGIEFSGMNETKYSDDVYFAHAGAPWERGTNENTNGLLRQFYPKRKGVSPFSSADSDKINALLNLRPRACLNWLSPYEVASYQLLHFT